MNVQNFKQFVKDLNQTKNWLLLSNVVLVSSLIILFNLDIIPLRVGDFIFFAVLIFAFALYRPGWVFLFFIGTIPLEIINLAPQNFGLSIRPYQFVGALLTGALLFRLATKKLYFKLAKLNLADYLVLLLVALNFLTVLFVPEKAIGLRSSVIFGSFAVLYFLVRNYIQNMADLKKITPFFLGSATVVIFYGIWQNIRFMRNLVHFEIMPGRPNSVFLEPDWLGIFLVLVISVLYVLIYDFYYEKNQAKSSGLFFMLSASFLLLILTVSRSAWLGALAATFIFLFIILTRLKFHPQHWHWKKTLRIKVFIASAFLISLITVYAFPLTKFELFNRARSTIAGLQEITISCDLSSELHNLLKEQSTFTIKDNSELEKYNCRHINLEEIEKERIAGNYVYEIYRNDPNVNARAEIYKKSWNEIKKNLILGVGLGNVGPILGRDDAGNFFNASNIFLEIWLGVGILGFLSLSLLFFSILLRALKNYFFSEKDWNKSFNLYIMTSWFAIVVANLFNAGLMLGFLWVYLAISQIEETEELA